MAHNFKKLSETEVEHVKKVAQRKNNKGNGFKNLEVSYSKHGNFTICLLKRGNKLYSGVTKRNPRDRNLDTTGINNALNSAAHEMFPEK